MKQHSWWLLATLLNVSVIAPAFGQVSYSPQPIAFGTVKLGATSATLSSTLANTGTDTLKFCGPNGNAFPGCVGKSSMTDTLNFQYVTDNCTARPSGGTCVLQYRFAPKKVGALVGANVVQTNHGPFPLNFTGTGQDTATPPPPPPPPPPPVSVVAGLGFGLAGVGLNPGEGYYLAATPRDSLGQPLGTPVSWAVTDTTLLSITKLANQTQVVQLVPRPRVGPDTLRDTVIAMAGGKVAWLPVTLLPALVVPPPPSPPPLVFGVQASWVKQFLPGCTARPGARCARGLVPILNDSTGQVQAQMADTAAFLPP